MNFHEREKKWNIIFLIFGIILMVLLVGMLYWSRETEAAESRRLQEMAKKTEDSAKTNAGTKVETEAEKPEEVKEELESVPEEEEKNPEGIVCWGDDLINGEASAKYSYKVVLQKLLEENGYNLPVQDKTLQGAGTLSMMTMAGVPAEEVQQFVTKHKEKAAGANLAVTETGIRDLTEEQTSIVFL